MIEDRARETESFLLVTQRAEQRQSCAQNASRVLDCSKKAKQSEEKVQFWDLKILFPFQFNQKVKCLLQACSVSEDLLLCFMQIVEIL